MLDGTGSERVRPLVSRRGGSGQGRRLHYEPAGAREDADGLEKGSKKSATTARQHGIVNTVTKRLRYFAEMS